MKKLLFILLLFVSFQSFGQTNRFPTIDSLKTYILKYVRNSTVESFTNLRLQNVVYGTVEMLDSITAELAAGGVDTIYTSSSATKDSIKYTKGGTTYTAAILDKVSLKLNISDTSAMLAPYLTRINSKVDSVTFSNDSAFYHTNGTAYYIGNIAAAAAGGDTTVFELVLDSTGQQNTRVLYAKNRKIASDDRFFYDETNNKLVINAPNISVGGPNTKLFVSGNSNLTGNVTGGSFIKQGGTSAQFLKADGSVDASTYALASSVPAQFNPIAGTNMSLSGIYPNITFNASGGGSSGDSTLQQITDNDSVTTHQIVLPTTRYTLAGFESATQGYVDTLVAFGNSFTTGVGSTGDSIPYAKLLAESYGLTFLNRGVSGTGVWIASRNVHAQMIPYHNNMTVLMPGLNDVRRGGDGVKTMSKIISGYSSTISAHFTKEYYAGYSSSVTRYGTFASYNAVTNAGKTTTAALTSANNDSLVYSFTDSTVLIGMLGSDGTVNSFSNFSIYIDNVLHGSGSANNRTDGLSDFIDSNRIMPFTYIVRGLTNAAHTLKIVNTSADTLIIDYVGHLIGAQYGKPLLAFDIPYLTATGYTLGGVYANATSVKIDTANNKIDSLIAANFTGYPVYRPQTNSYYTNTIASGDVTGDNIHPTDQGHDHIRDAGVAAYNYSNTSTITEGIVRYDFYNQKPSYFDGRFWRTLARADQTDSSLFVHKAGTETITGVKIFAPTLTTTGGTPQLLKSLSTSGTLTSTLSSDTLVGLDIKTTLSGSSLQKYGVRSDYDFNIRGIRIGGGPNTDQTNAVLGRGALGSVTTGTNNGQVAIGYQAGASLNNSSYNNTIGGFNAGFTLTSGVNNSIWGTNAMLSSSAGSSDNSGIGHGIFASSTGSRISGVGKSAGRLAGSDGVYLGYQAGYFETGANKLFIDNTQRGNEADGRVKALVYGVFATTTAAQTFKVNGNLNSNSFSTSYVAKTTTYTATLDDHTIEATTGTFTITLPTAVGNTGLEYWITNSGTGVITIATTSSQTFVNVTATPTTLTVNQFEGFVVKSNGANWIAR